MRRPSWLRPRVAAAVAFLVIGVVAEWLHWEVEKSFIDWARRKQPFPAPFYAFYWPRGAWEDLAITLAILAMAVLAYLALSYRCPCKKE